MNHKVLKFIITPVLVILNDEGKPVGELVTKQIIHYTGNELKVKELEKQLEELANAGYFAEKANSG